MVEDSLGAQRGCERSRRTLVEIHGLGGQEAEGVSTIRKSQHISGSDGRIVLFWSECSDLF